MGGRKNESCKDKKLHQPRSLFKIVKREVVYKCVENFDGIYDVCPGLYMELPGSIQLSE